MKKLLYLLILLTPGIMWSQNKNTLSFNTTVYDFGTFGEDDESPSYQFKFINTGQKAIAISHVSTNCGCTATEYTQEPIPPGKSGFIVATYNPKGRPGKFSKTITAFISGSNSPIKLTIQGEVLSGVKRKYAGYQYVMGGLQLKNNTVYLRQLSNVKQTSTSILVINSSEETLNITLESGSTALKGEAIPKLLRPGEKGELEITYDTNRKLQGNERIEILLNGKKEIQNFIKVEIAKP